MFQIVVGFKTFNRTETPVVVYCGHNPAEMNKAAQEAPADIVRFERHVLNRGLPFSRPVAPKPAASPQEPEGSEGEQGLENGEQVPPAGEQVQSEQPSTNQDEPGTPPPEPVVETPAAPAEATETFFNAEPEQAPAPAPTKKSKKKKQ
jgi:hypothetical protein